MRFKRTTFIISAFLLLNINVFGQTKTKVNHKILIDSLLIDHGEIYRYIRPTEDSSLGAVKKPLNKDQIKHFIELWNGATYLGVCKFKAKYFIDLYSKDGTKRTFRINGNAKENRDYCYEFEDKKFVKTLWNE